MKNQNINTENSNRNEVLEMNEFINDEAEARATMEEAIDNLVKYRMFCLEIVGDLQEENNCPEFLILNDIFCKIAEILSKISMVHQASCNVSLEKLKSNNLFYAIKVDSKTLQKYLCFIITYFNDVFASKIKDDYSTSKVLVLKLITSEMLVITETIEKSYNLMADKIKENG